MSDDAPKRGRPSLYTPELAAEICARLAEGQSLREICRNDHMPSESRVREWASTDREGFSSHYATAREIGYRRMADELLEIADDGTNDWVKRQRQDGSTETVFDAEHYQRSRLRVDTRKWLLSKALPKIYGDKLDLNHSGNLTVEVVRFSDKRPADKPDAG
jgi:hypothetical protein